MAQYERIKRELEHKGTIIDFYGDYVKLPNGKVAKLDFIQHKGAAAMIAEDNQGKILMVRQYRNALDRETLEIPAGGKELDEDMKACAIRELEEETGYAAKNAEHLLDIYTTVAFCNEKIGIYFTKEIEKSEQNLDEDEFVNVERYTIEELLQMIEKGIIQDGKTVSALLAYYHKMKEA